MYHLNIKEKAVVNGETGEIVRPSCFADLSSYHSYLTQRGHPVYAQSVLKQVFEGEKVITKMIQNSQKARIQ